jgi:hypothetical protein
MRVSDYLTAAIATQGSAYGRLPGLLRPKRTKQGKAAVNGSSVISLLLMLLGIFETLETYAAMLSMGTA